jgi:hypothetical protein
LIAATKIAIVAIWFMELRLAPSSGSPLGRGVPLVAGDVHPHLQRHCDAVTGRLRSVMFGVRRASRAFGERAAHFFSFPRGTCRDGTRSFRR